MIPVLVDFNQKHILVVGFGPIGQHKAAVLSEDGGVITVIDKYLPIDIIQRYPAYTFRKGAYTIKDLDTMDFVIAATDDRALNAQVAKDAGSRHLLCSVVDSGSTSDFTFMSVVKRGDLAIGISTKHRFPGLSKKVRLMLEEYLPEDYGDYIEYMANARQTLLVENAEDKDQRIKALMSTTYEAFRQERD